MHTKLHIEKRYNPIALLFSPRLESKLHQADHVKLMTIMHQFDISNLYFIFFTFHFAVLIYHVKFSYWKKCYSPMYHPDVTDNNVFYSSLENSVINCLTYFSFHGKMFLGGRSLLQEECGKEHCDIA